MISYSFFHFMAKHKTNANSLFVNIMLNVNPWNYCQHKFHSMLWACISYHLNSVSLYSKFIIAELSRDLLHCKGK